MSRAVFLVALLNGLLLIGLGLVNVSILVLTVPLLVYVGVALLRLPEPSTLHGRRQITTHTFTTEGKTKVTLSLKNEGTAIGYLVVQDPLTPELTVIDGDVQATAALAAGETLTLTYTLQGQRGKASLKNIEVTGGDTFGLFPWQVSIEAQTQLSILPAFPYIRRIAIRPLRTIGFTGPIPSRESGTGIDFFGVRQYQMGDPLRRVNWRATARYLDRPFTTEFEQDRIADVGLILDARPDQLWVSEEQSLLEDSVSATAALADALLREGHRVGLLLYGLGHWVFPGYGRVQRERIMRTLAETETTHSRAFNSLEHLPTRFFPPRSQLLIVSSLKNEDFTSLVRLRANGYSVVIVSPDPVSFEANVLPQDTMLPTAVRLARLERQLLLQRLRQAGIVIVDWQVDRSLDQAMAATLLRTPPIRHIREMNL